MSNQWVPIFDKASAGERGKDINLPEIVRNYDAKKNPAPAIIGHASSYPKDTRIPADRWVEYLKTDGEILFAQYSDAPRLTVPIPEPFQELVSMRSFFDQVVNNGMYKKRSIGIEFTPEGQQLHHVGYLGATKPQCKGMPDHQFNEHPELRLLTAEFKADIEFQEFEEEEMPINEPKSKTKPKEFATLDVTTLDDVQLEALDKIINMLREKHGLETDASVEQILGAMTSEKSEEEEITEALATAGAVALTPGTSISSFNEKLAKIEKKNPLVAAVMKTIVDMGAMSAKVKEFETTPTPPAPGTTPPAEGTTPPTEFAVPTLGKSEEDCTKEADKAKETLTAAKNWLPSWDEKLYPLMKLLANVKMDSGSGLDILVSALSDISGLAEMQAYSKVIDYRETVREYNEVQASKDPKTFIAEKGKQVENLTVRSKIMDYQKQHNIASYGEATHRMMEMGELTDSDFE